MKFYCGIDLSARDSHVGLIDESHKKLVDVKVKNDLPRIVRLLEPYKDNLKIVVERAHSTRAGEYGSLRRLMLRHGILSSKQLQAVNLSPLREYPR